MNGCLIHGHHKVSFLRTSLSRDLQRYLNKSPMNRAAGDTPRKRLSAFFTPDLLAVFFYRLAHWLYANKWIRSARMVTLFNFFAHKVYIGPQSCIGPGFRLPHPVGVIFCGTAGSELTLYALSVCCKLQGHAEGAADGAPTLGDRVTLGAGAVVLGPIQIGDDSKISFTTRLDRDAPAGVLVVSSRRRLLSNAPASFHTYGLSNGSLGPKSHVPPSFVAGNAARPLPDAVASPDRFQLGEKKAEERQS